MATTVKNKKDSPAAVKVETMLEAYTLICTAKAMSELYEHHAGVTSKYVHATSRGHEAVQAALGMQLNPQDFLFPYYRDDALLLAIGMKPYELMLQLLAKKDDPFSGGRTYYSHPSLRRDDMPKIPHQSSATGMQAIPATGAAMGMQYMEHLNLATDYGDEMPVAVCSMGDASITEGEVSEAFQMAALHRYPILFFIQDNEWGISAYAEETRAQNASEYVQGFKGLGSTSIDGADFIESYKVIRDTLRFIRKERKPFLIHANVPLLGHHTSGVRMESYREEMHQERKRDPVITSRKHLLSMKVKESDIVKIEKKAVRAVAEAYDKATQAADPPPESLYNFDLAPTPVTEESGIREPQGKSPTVMVDCALFAIKELMEKHPECLFYGQDVGGRLGGVFREAATLAETFGDKRVFNTPIQEAYIIGSTVGMSAVGCKPIVEIQFADYIWPGLNQLFTEASRSYYLSNGKWPVSCVIRVPTGAYGSGGPYHSSSVESVVCNIKGIKVAYPSNGADLKGLLKAAYYDPNPVVVFEHKGLYWSKPKGTAGAKTVVPDEDYIIPFGKARTVLTASDEDSNRLSIITYGMGVYWALEAARHFPGRIEIVDMRTLSPFDEKTIFESVKKNNRCLLVTEEPVLNSFAQGLAGVIQDTCFAYLDAPVRVIGSKNLPAIPLNSGLEAEMIPSAEKVGTEIERLLNY